jgi:hypothetical protein
MTLECPTGMLVSGLSGATGYFNADNTGFSIKALSMICSRVHVTDAEISFEPSSTQSAGSLMGNVVETFADDCPEDQAVVGFVGRAGHIIDALTTVCAPLSIAQRLQ